MEEDDYEDEEDKDKNDDYEEEDEYGNEEDKDKNDDNEEGDEYENEVVLVVVTITLRVASIMMMPVII